MFQPQKSSSLFNYRNLFEEYTLHNIENPNLNKKCHVSRWQEFYMSKIQQQRPHDPDWLHHTPKQERIVPATPKTCHQYSQKEQCNTYAKSVEVFATCSTDYSGIYPSRSSFQTVKH
ncbi:unnamed protein product [Phyllotreta striolata]|uniref:Uncharacterized protein n=1 Tax=Phyllotreta striolata TaxID=444603 RepID=A0A9N9XP14_PHYSR|nr:unnamed protein product [Phyllotreta striolata]